MDNKEQWIVAAVTTREAMEVCVSGEAPVFCVENPLFSEIIDKLDTMECLADYDKEIHEEKQIALLRKVRGEHAFEDGRYEMVYLPLQWDDWIS